MILLIGNYAYDQQESMQRFSRLLLKGHTATGAKCELLTPAPFFGRLRPGSIGLAKWLGYLDKFLLFPVHLRCLVARLKRQGELVVHICDHSSAHYTLHLADVSTVVTCHDVLALRSAQGNFPENRTSFTGRLYQRLITRGLRKAQHIAAVSEATRAQLIEVISYPPEQTSVIALGLNHPYHPMAAAEAARHLPTPRGASLIEMPYLLHVGGNQWYKNRLGLLEIFSEIKARYKNPLRLVIAGLDLPSDLRRRFPTEILDSILEVGKVGNEQLRALYSAAAALLFPSKYEGFGWPILEAQACRCPVATTDRPPMNTVGGTSVVYFGPDHPGQAAELVIALLRETGEQKERRGALGLANAASFSSDRMIQSYQELYTEVIAKLPRGPGRAALRSLIQPTPGVDQS